MKIILKGGVWKNTEDEILKAAVMKYGKNQWARISSLLNRKSAKQCKARWYEWLDPSIKKTEWSKEEDEKLLHLAKLLPTQWRTIAPMVGRTPAQCLERYQRLLDEAEMREMGIEGGADGHPTADEIRRLRPGEIDPDPETKPAKPDPIDMDEDEKEMLSEARARLANTQGKKAKRKAREKQLEQARRLAGMQKRRELKAAGIEWRYRSRKRGEFDYNAEMPFPVYAPAGFYDTSEEKERVVEKDFINKAIVDIEGKSRTQQDEEARQADAKKKKEREEKGVFKVPNLKGLEEQQRIAKRRKLNLPQPQIQDGELEQLAKIGQSSELALAAVDSEAPSKGLLSEYSQNILSERTPQRTATSFDHLHVEATNILRQQNLQTPLLAGDNVDLLPGGTGYSGATPQRIITRTPVPPSSTTPQVDRSRVIGGVTPIRDDLRINDNIENSWDGNDRFSETTAAPSIEAARKSLIFGLKQLPKPKNDFEVIVPDEPENEKEIAAEPKEEDMAEVEAKLIQEHAEKERTRLEKRSTAVKQSLPRPISVESIKKFQLTGDDEIKKLIIKESAELMLRDLVEYPKFGVPPASAKAPVLDDISPDEIRKAKDEIEKELGSTEFVKITPEHRKPSPIAQKSSKFIYCTEANQIEANSALFEYASQMNSQLSQNTSKLRKKLEVTLGGYEKRSHSLADRLCKEYEKLEKYRVDLEGFKRLLMIESQVVIQDRLDKLQIEVKKAQDSEREQQERYRKLQSKAQNSNVQTIGVSSLPTRTYIHITRKNNIALAGTYKDGLVLFRMKNSTLFDYPIATFGTIESTDSTFDSYHGEFFVPTTATSRIFAIITDPRTNPALNRILIFDFTNFTDPNYQKPASVINGNLLTPSKVFSVARNVRHITMDWDHLVSYVVGDNAIYRLALNDHTNFRMIDFLETSGVFSHTKVPQGVTYNPHTFVLSIADGYVPGIWQYDCSKPLSNAFIQKINTTVPIRSILDLNGNIFAAQDSDIVTNPYRQLQLFQQNQINSPALLPPILNNVFVTKIVALDTHLLVVTRNGDASNRICLFPTINFISFTNYSCSSFGVVGIYEMYFVSESIVHIADAYYLYTIDLQALFKANNVRNTFKTDSKTLTGSIVINKVNTITLSNAMEKKKLSQFFAASDSSKWPFAQIRYSCIGSFSSCISMSTGVTLFSLDNGNFTRTTSITSLENTFVGLSELVNSTSTSGVIAFRLDNQFGARITAGIQVYLPFRIPPTYVNGDSSYTDVNQDEYSGPELLTIYPSNRGEILSVYSSLSPLLNRVNPTNSISADKQIDFMGNIIRISIFAWIMAAIGLGSLIVACYCMARNINKPINKHRYSTGIPEATDFSHLTEMKATSYSEITMMNTHMPLAIPAYKLMNLHAFNLMKLIAEGGAGKIYLANFKNPTSEEEKKIVVLKLIKNAIDQIYVDLFFQEVAITQAFSGHRNFVLLLGYLDEPKGMVLKLYSLGSLKNLLEIQDVPVEWTFGFVMNVICDIATAIVELHGKQISHNDIKPDNILIDKELNGGYVAALCDFSVSTVFGNAITGVKSFKTIPIEGHTIGYAAPEMISRHNSENYTNLDADTAIRSDMYSLGMTMMATLIRDNPWGTLTNSEVTKLSNVGKRPKFPNNLQAMYPQAKCLNELKIIINTCWAHDPKKRPNANQVLTVLKKL